MSDRALDVVEFLLTAHIYSENRQLDENDLPPRYRRVFWAESDEEGEVGGVERPLVATEKTARQATGVDDPWETVSDLMFTQKEEFAGRISLTQPEMALDWLVQRSDRDRFATNPTLAAAAEDRDDVDVSHEEARKSNRPIQADRLWIDSLLESYFDEEEDAEMLDLVSVRAPEEIEMTLEDLVLTTDQEG
jgi:hypothetical protein